MCILLIVLGFDIRDPSEVHWTLMSGLYEDKLVIMSWALGLSDGSMYLIQSQQKESEIRSDHGLGYYDLCKGSVK